MASRQIPPGPPSLVRKTAAATAVLLAVTLTGPPTAAYAAAGPINTQGQGLRANIALLNGLAPLTASSPTANWTTGGPAVTRNQSNGIDLGVPILAPNILGTGLVTATARPETGGGSASSKVLGLNLLGNATLGADAVDSTCVMTQNEISGGTDAANLKVGGQTVNPAVNADIGVPNVLSGKVNRQLATWDQSTGRLSYTVQGLQVNLLSGLAVVASGTVTVAESVCSGIVRLGSLSTTPRSIVPGGSATPAVTVRNTGDIAAPNTVITIPAPPTGYTLGAPTVTGGGECTPSSTQIRCSGVTVPGGGSVTVSLPVTVDSSALTAADWAPGASAILARSTPIAAVAGTTVDVDGGGPLVNVLAPQSAGAITIDPVVVPANRSATTTIRLANQGPSDATTTLTIPIGNRPGVLSVPSATVGGTPCTGISGPAITCPGVSVPAGGTATVTLRVAATAGATPGTVWNLEDVRATLNGTVVLGAGRFATVSDPEVNLSGGVTINRVTAAPGGPEVRPTVRVANIGMVPATATTITLPAPPAGYDVGAVTTNGGGQCASTTAGIECTGVTVPANGAILVTVPVTLAPDVTAGWTAGTAGPVTATSDDSTGQATGPIVLADPDWTLEVESTPPGPGTVRAGQDTTITVTVTDAGPSDAQDAEFVVVAPGNTTFEPLPLPSPAVSLCQVLSPTTLRCTVDIPVAGPPVVLRLPLRIDDDADNPVDGGCVSLDNDTDCGGPDDEPLDDIVMGASLGRRLTISPQPATITPGTSGAGGVRVTSTVDEDNLTVTVPRGQLPAGFTATPAGGCTSNATAIICTGVTLEAGEEGGITVPVALRSDVVPPRTWTATDIRISDGVETITFDGALAIAGPPDWEITATISGPADGAVQPGGTGTLTVIGHNEGPSDAVDATFAVVAPRDTTFEPLTGDAAQGCTLASGNSRAICTVDLADDAFTPPLSFVFRVPAGADPYEPIPGACVDLDGVPGCGPADEPLDPVVLGVPFDRQVALSYTAVSVTPGTTGDALVRVTAHTVDQTGLRVVVPISPMPAGLGVAGVTGPAGADCQIAGAQIICTGVDVDMDSTVSITIRVAATRGAVSGTTWTANGITVSRGADQITGDGRLAVAGAPRYTFDVNVGDPGPLPPGQSTELDVTVTNLGPSDAPPGTISILAPRNTTFGDPPSAPTSDLCQKVSPIRWTCAFGLPYGQPVVLKLPIVVGPDTPPGDLPGGCLDADNNEICDGDDPDLGPLTTSTPFDQELSVWTEPATIAPGTTGNARVRLQANRDLDDLVVTIPMLGKPMTMNVTTGLPSNGGTCALDPGVALVCTGVDVPASGATILIPVAVDAGAPGDLTWTSRAITARNSDGDVATGAGLLVRTGAPTYRITASATSPADYTVAPGETGDYQVRVTNQGPSDATDALVTLHAPFNTRWGDLTNAGAVDSACDTASDVLLVCVVTLTSGQFADWQVPVYVYPGADPGVRITGGCVDTDGDSLCGAGNDDFSLLDWWLRADFGSALRITNDYPVVRPGTSETSTFTIGAGQTGGTVDVEIRTDTLPEGLTVSPLGTCTRIPDAIECATLSVPAGQVIDIPVSVTAATDAVAGRIWTAPVRVRHGADTFSRNVRAALIGDPEHELTVDVIPPAPGTLRPGGTGELDITVTNLGPAYFPGAEVDFEAPTGTTFLPPAAPLSSFCRRTSPTHVSCTFDLPVGPRNFSLSILVPGTAQSPLSGGCFDRDFDNRCTQPEDDPFPPIILGASLNDRIQLTTEVGEATPGLSGTGHLIVTADVAYDDVTITIPKTLPTGFTVTGAAGPTGSTCDYAGTEIVCTDVDVPAGPGSLIAITVQAASSLREDVTWTAYSITLTLADGQSTGTSGEILTTTEPISPVTYTPEALTGVVRPGGTATLTIDVHNDGPSDAVDQRVKIIAPSQSTFQPLSGEVADVCFRSSSTVLQCRFDQTAQQADRRWIIALLISGTAGADTPVTGGCVSANDDADCGDPDDDLIPSYALGEPLSEVVSVEYQRAVVAPGGSATPRLVFTSTEELTDLTLTIPLGNLPGDFTVTGAGPDNGDCEVRAGDAVECTGMTFIDGDPFTVELTVTASASVDAGTRWRGVGVELSDEAGDEPLISSGLLVSVTAADYDVTVTTGALSPNPASPGQTVTLPVRLHNNGPSNAEPYVMVVVLPTGTTHGPLPAGCTGSGNGRIVSCEVTIEADAEESVDIPIVVDENRQDGDVLGGGCLDNVGQDSFDYVCTGPDDEALPTITVSAPTADLRIRYLNPRPKAVRGGTIRLGLPYSNVGNDSAAGVRFTIDPPDGVRVTAADILLDATGAVGEPGADETVTATCTAATDGDANTVVCIGPDQPTGDDSQLWMSLYIASGLKAGTYPVSVEISTTSPEGNTVDNFAVAQLTVTAAGVVTPEPTVTPTAYPTNPPNDNGRHPGWGAGGDNLPKTGANVFSLLVFSILLIAVGVAVLLVARNRPGPQPGGAL